MSIGYLKNCVGCGKKQANVFLNKEGLCPKCSWKKAIKKDMPKEYIG